MTRGPGRHRRAAGRPWRLTATIAVVLALLVAAGIVVTQTSGDDRPDAAPPASASSTTPDSDATLTSKTPATPTSPASSSMSSTSTATTPPGPPPVLTPGGMWWGVDSTEPISNATLSNVAGFYRGHPRPQFWGRYLRGSYAVTRHELAFARAHHIYVFLIVGDDNCSGCSGGDVCGNDDTSQQAKADVEKAVRAARKLRVPEGAVLFKDIEQVAACQGEPTADYLLAWYQAMGNTQYRTGFYGNVHRQYYDFPRAYCRAASRSASFADGVVLDMNQPEPQLGAEQGTVGPHQAPPFRPHSPSCAVPARTVIWQYGESIDSDNLTDIDQARPTVEGMLAPDGSVS